MRVGSRNPLETWRHAEGSSAAGSLRKLVEEGDARERPSPSGERRREGSGGAGMDGRFVEESDARERREGSR